MPVLRLGARHARRVNSDGADYGARSPLVKGGVERLQTSLVPVGCASCCMNNLTTSSADN
jgi:hypothetical protein